MERQWTPSQLAAIETRSKTLLVSAAAGSGKTASLTERIIRRLTDEEHPADIGKMLIVTFTRAATAELKEKISAAVSDALARHPESRHLSEQIVRLGEARICTIDAFCLDVVRSSFSLLGLPPKFRMADGAELTILKNTAMNRLIERMHKSECDFGHFTDHFSTLRSDKALSEIFLSLYEDLLKNPSGIDFLRENTRRLHEGAERDFFHSTFGEVSARETADFFRAVIDAYEEAVRCFEAHESAAKYLPIFGEELAFARVMLAFAEGKCYAEARESILSFEPRRLPPVKADLLPPEAEAHKSRRTKFNAQIKALKTGRFLLSPEDISRAMRESAEASDTLCRLLSAYDEEILREKRSRGICDFDDIRRYAYTLLVNPDESPTPLARSLAESFDEIYIDEYQDVDRVQDLLFSSIARPNNRFLVGDIKQSIYGFRGAEPSVFGAYRERFPTHGTEDAENSQSCAIYMSNNFRCDKPVIDFVNLVCGNIFSTCTGGLSYRAEDDLIHSKKSPDGYTPPPVEVVLLSRPSTKEKADPDFVDTAPDRPEAAYIANRIEELLESGKKADGTPVRYPDIAILARGKGTLLTIAEELKERGIPNCISAEEEFFENPDVLLMLCLLNTIDNPRRDVYLTGAMRSPLYLFTLEELVTIRAAGDESLSLFDALLAFAQSAPHGDLKDKCDRFLLELQEYRTAASTLPVDKLLRRIFDHPHLVASGALSTVSRDGRHLLRLYEYARKFEAGAFRGLSQFIAYIDRLMAEKAKMESPSEGGGDAVQLMTIHKSKGLEFPVCFVAGAGQQFSMEDKKDSLLYDGDIGVAMKLSDDSGFGRINTPMRDAIAARITEKAVEEEMRILYVALTRARERLIVTAHPPRQTADGLMDTVRLYSSSLTRYNVMRARSYIEWILSSLYLSPARFDGCATCTVIPDVEIPQGHGGMQESAAPEAYDEEEVRRLEEEFRSRFAFVYPHRDRARLPAKLSVSVLSPVVLDEDKPEERFLPKTANAKDRKAAERGTATHCFLQFCDFGRGKERGAAEELARLVEQRFLAPDTAELCRMDELEKFFRSDLLDDLTSAERIYREQRFNIFLPAGLFTEDSDYRSAIGDEKILVQGVIDLFYIDRDGKLILCDYKTDRLSEKEIASDALLAYAMKQRHGEQLTYYALALEQLMGRKPDRILVYATAAGRAVEVHL